MYTVEAQGDLLKIKKYHVMTERGTGWNGAHRDKITAFSRKSRKRLLEVFARLDVSKQRAVFVTLTFSSIPEQEFAYKSLRKFFERLRRRFKNVCAIWRKEYQERGSIHYHIIFFGLPFIPQRELQQCWEACTGENRSIVHVTLLKSKKHALLYVSKYIAKVEDGESTTSLDSVPYPHDEKKPPVGRFWGYYYKAFLPMGILRRVHTDRYGGLAYLKWGMRVASRGRCSQHNMSGTLFTQEAKEMFYYFLEISQICEVNPPTLLRYCRHEGLN